MFFAACGLRDIQSLRPANIVSVDLNDALAGMSKDQMVDGKRELPASTGVIDVKIRSSGRWRRSGPTSPVRVGAVQHVVRHMAPDEAVSPAMNALKKAFA